MQVVGVLSTKNLFGWAGIRIMILDHAECSPAEIVLNEGRLQNNLGTPADVYTKICNSI